MCPNFRRAELHVDVFERMDVFVDVEVVCVLLQSSCMVQGPSTQISSLAVEHALYIDFALHLPHERCPHIAIQTKRRDQKEKASKMQGRESPGLYV